jgi:RNA polymerase sigma factor (sigma-70 family)
MDQDTRDRDLLERIAAGGPAAWPFFLDSCADTIFRVVRLFADAYDDRMDLFLFVCGKLEEGEMKRVRAFRYRPEAPCRLSTWLSVVVRNLAVDFIREKEGRFRPFRTVEKMDDIDRLVFEYHLRDGRPLAEVRDRLERSHGIRIEDGPLLDRAGRVRESLSASQRWRLLARLTEKRRHLPLDPVAGGALRGDEIVPLTDAREDPEAQVRRREADHALLEAMRVIPARERLAVTLRFRDGLTSREVARVMRVPAEEAERLARRGVDRLRASLSGAGFAPPDFEPSQLEAMWPS